MAVGLHKIVHTRCLQLFGRESNPVLRDALDVLQCSLFNSSGMLVDSWRRKPPGRTDSKGEGLDTAWFVLQRFIRAFRYRVSFNVLSFLPVRLPDFRIASKARLLIFIPS